MSWTDERIDRLKKMWSEGATASQIADELSLSVKTISTYRTRILEKMVMQSNAELTHYAIQNKLIEQSGMG